MSKYYAGIGSRKTPRDVLDLMYDLAVYLARKGWILRSGGAEGADRAFEHGALDAPGKTEIYLADDANDAAMELAAKYHPAWNRCGTYAKKLHARNCFQVLGADLKTPSKVVACWTPDGSTGITTQLTGGTGQAIRIAKAYGIKIFNLALPEHRSHIETVLYKHIPK